MSRQRYHWHHKTGDSRELKTEEAMLLEALLIIALCIGVPMLVARCISYGGSDESSYKHLTLPTKRIG